MVDLKGNINQKQASYSVLPINYDVSAMDANKGRYMAVNNIPGVFLHADMEHYVHVIL